MRLKKQSANSFADGINVRGLRQALSPSSCTAWCARQGGSAILLALHFSPVSGVSSLSTCQSPSA
eukprot:1332890-Rhodomonas_salina.1